MRIKLLKEQQNKFYGTAIVDCKFLVRQGQLKKWMDIQFNLPLYLEAGVNIQRQDF
jgi:hypothetical protein